MHGKDRERHSALSRQINAVVQRRLLPFIRRRYDAPDAFHCYSLVRRYEALPLCLASAIAARPPADRRPAFALALRRYRPGERMGVTDHQDLQACASAPDARTAAGEEPRRMRAGGGQAGDRGRR